MSILINIGAVLTGVALITIIISLMVQRKINASESVLWLLIGFFTIVLGFFPRIINLIADRLGVWYPPTITFFVAYIGLLFIVFKNSVTASIHRDQLNELLLELILAKDKIKKLEQEVEELKEGED